MCVLIARAYVRACVCVRLVSLLKLLGLHELLSNGYIIKLRLFQII